MTAPHASPIRCTVTGEDLPVSSGGSRELCAAIERALVARHAIAPLSISVEVRKRSILSATVALSDGRHLPAIKVAEMDRGITKVTFERLGSAIAAQVEQNQR